MILWTESDPDRLVRDQAEVAALAPELTFWRPGERGLLHGGWTGTLPVWPFERPAPELGALVPRGLEIELEYLAAYPLVPPRIIPLAPEPEWIERTQSAWHVLPSGGLCLLQSDGAWLPEASVTELLLKAAGWHIEYTLMKAGAIKSMSVSGIVSDDRFDDLIATTSFTGSTGAV